MQSPTDMNAADECIAKHCGAVARWLVCHWGGKYTDCRPPPPPPHAHTHTNTHAAFLPEFLISLHAGADAGFWRGGGGLDLIDAAMTWRGARFARENFCGAGSNFSTAGLYWKLRQSTPINSALCSSSTITITKTGSN